MTYSAAEFRRRFLTGQSARWYVYLTCPLARLGAVIDLGPAIIDTPERIAEIAEQAQAQLGAFHPPQGYTTLRNHPELLSICTTITAGSPSREMAVSDQPLGMSSPDAAFPTTLPSV